MQSRESKQHASRRDFLKYISAIGGTFLVTPLLKACTRAGLIEPSSTPTTLPQKELVVSSAVAQPTVPVVQTPTSQAKTTKMALVKARNRSEGIRRAFALLNTNPVKDKSVLLKPNLNSADPAPASSHPDTIRTLVEVMREMGARRITLADRSGMGHSRDVMQQLGISEMARELGFETLSFEDLEAGDWEMVQFEGSHWEHGYPMAKPVLEAEAVVQTCCLKPHRFGGHFTLSLKNSVGMAGKYFGNGGHNYMTELHSSPYQRQMIAEINSSYMPALVILDGVEAFIDMGPDTGTKVHGDVILASTDRIAIDVIGLAILRDLGYKGIASRNAIFQQDQILRAVELGLGIDSVDKIQFATDDSLGEDYISHLLNFFD